MISSRQMRVLLRIPEAHALKSHDGIINITTGESCTDFYEKDSAGKAIAKYAVTVTDDFSGGGSVTWKKTLLEG